MFDGLRKKLSDAVKGFVKKEEKTIEERQEEAKIEEKTEPKTEPVQKQAEHAHHQEKQKEKEIVKVSIATKIKSTFSSSVHLSDSEIEDFLENTRIPLLESDVSYETTDAFIETMRKHLKETKVDSKGINKELIALVRQSLFDVLSKAGKGVDLIQFIKEQAASGNAPVKILFLGPNGTGKTTTMAKIAYKLKNSGVSSILSASDTFRAAAIEQTEHHANKVGVRVIKGKYGADPASIAFDAIASAKANGIQTVLIDTAGRQETNRNLISEMEKMVRVAKPDLIIFVGESTAGNALSEQVKEFNKFMKINGIILTKLDCDVKGGNAISIAYTTGIPLLFLGTGEAYDALVPYTPEFIVDSIMPNHS